MSVTECPAWLAADCMQTARRALQSAKAAFTASLPAGPEGGRVAVALPYQPAEFKRALHRALMALHDVPPSPFIRPPRGLMESRPISSASTRASTPDHGGSSQAHSLNVVDEFLEWAKKHFMQHRACPATSLFGSRCVLRAGQRSGAIGDDTDELEESLEKAAVIDGWGDTHSPPKAKSHQSTRPGSGGHHLHCTSWPGQDKQQLPATVWPICGQSVVGLGPGDH